MDLELSGKVVIVTGGSKGIGAGLVEAFVKEGAKVVSVARNHSEETLKKYKSLDYPVLCPSTDVRERASVTKTVGETLKAFGRVDILVNNAGTNHKGKIEDITEEQWDEVLDVNLKGAFLFCQAAVPHMKKTGGSIVNVSSIAGRHRSVSSGIHYVCSKAGLLGLTKQLAMELAREKVRVNAVCPSQTHTPMLDKINTKDELKTLATNIPMGRIAQVNEQTNVILFLASAASSYMTGAIVDVNGGQW